MGQVRILFGTCIIVALIAMCIAPVTASNDAVTGTPVVNGTPTVPAVTNGTVLSGLVSPENTPALADQANTTPGVPCTAEGNNFTLSDPLLNTSADNPYYQEAGSNGNWVINESGEAWQVDTANSSAPNYDPATNTFSGFGSGFAILINASNVIFDGMGAILDGGGNTDYGIIVNNQSADNYDVFDTDPANALGGISITNITLINFNIAGILLNNVIGLSPGEAPSTDTPASDITDVNASYNNLAGNTAGGGIVLQNSRYVDVSDNAANSNKGNGSFTSDIYLNTSDSNTLVNNTATGDHMGFYLNSSGNNTLIDNTANRNWGGIVLENSRNNTLVNNNADLNRDTGIVVVTSSNNNSLINNTANSNGWEGIILDDSSNNNNLIGNTANLNSWDGISIYNSGNNTLINNTANSNIYGFLLQRNSGNNTLIGNTANSNSDTGIYLRISDKNNILIGNTANLNANGIYLNSSGNNNTLIGNTASGNRMYGIYLNSSSNNNTLIGNAANGNYYGFSLQNSGNNILISNNATGNDYGFYLFASGNNTLTGNTANDSYIGIRLFISNANNLTDNTANSNWAGIDSASSNNNILVSNNVNGNRGQGIRLARSANNNTLINNTADSNDLEGILLDDSSNNNRLTGNNASGNGYYGINLESSNYNILTSNNASNNGMDGFSLADSNGNTITRNTGASNMQNGINLYNSSGNSLNGNRVTGNNESGLYLAGSSSSQVIYNNYFNNTVDSAFGDDYTGTDNTWNVNQTPGTNIIGGPYTGGNYWASPDGTGFSETHPDRGDGFCTEPYVLAGQDTDYLPLHTYTPEPTFKADFTVSPVMGTAPLKVQCTDKSIGTPIRYLYSFGDGSSATGPNPVHTYTHPGVYNISLSILKYNRTTGSMISSVAVKTNVITVESAPFILPVANFDASPVTGTAPLTVYFTDLSTGDPTRLMYDFGDGVNATGPNPVHIYRFPGVYNVTLSVMKYDRMGGSMISDEAVRKDLVVVN